MSVETVVSIEEALAEKIKALPIERQQQLLDYAEFLEQKEIGEKPKRSLAGLWADMNVSITEEGIKEARREMWGNFPREKFFTDEAK